MSSSEPLRGEVRVDDDRIEIAILLKHRAPLTAVPLPPDEPVPPMLGDGPDPTVTTDGPPPWRSTPYRTRLPPPPRTQAEFDAQSQRTHGKGFAWVNWYGTRYDFTAKQRAVVAALWRAWEEGEDFVHKDALLEVADSSTDRVRDLFRKHPAWGTMIVIGIYTGGAPGTYRLALGP